MIREVEYKASPGLLVLVLLPPAFVVNAVVWWMSLPPGAWR